MLNGPPSSTIRLLVRHSALGTALPAFYLSPSLLILHHLHHHLRHRTAPHPCWLSAGVQATAVTMALVVLNVPIFQRDPTSNLVIILIEVLMIRVFLPTTPLPSPFSTAPRVLTTQANLLMVVTQPVNANSTVLMVTLAQATPAS